VTDCWRRRRERFQRACFATVRSLTIVERSTPARSAASTVLSPLPRARARSHNSATTTETASPYDLRCCPGERPDSVIKTLLLIVPEASQMWANQTRICVID
jgi:hypothetical protein